MSTGQLFDPEEFEEAAPPEAGREPLAGSVGAPVDEQLEGTPVRVRPDVSGLDKEFDYLVPEKLIGRVSIGSMVRIELNHRNVAGWVTAIGSETPEGVVLRPINKISSVGPSAEVIDLARWAAHRWGGRLATILKTASPPKMVSSLPEEAAGAASPAPSGVSQGDSSAAGVSVIRVSPNEDLVPLLADIAELGSTLVITPRLRQATNLAGGLRRRGLSPRLHPRDWAAAAGRGGIVLGARSSVWARLPGLAAIVVLDEHDEALQEERNPTWHARDVAIERAARAGIPCYLVSPSPSLAALEHTDGALARPPRDRERAGWPIVEIIDRREDEPGRGGLFSSRLSELVRGTGTVLAVLNRKGRAVMLACAMCGELARTEDGERLMVEQDGGLVAPSTGEQRPMVCAVCASTSLKRLRLGVSRAAEELGAMIGEAVDELTGSAAEAGDAGFSAPSRVVVGTEAALHQLDRADTVIFLDFDQELLAPRYRSAEQAMALLVLAARLTGGRAAGGRVVIQTRTPDHRVLRAALRADPGTLATAEQHVRQPMGWPPYGALAEVSGASAAEFVEPLRSGSDVSVLGPRDDGHYLLRADDPDRLASVLAEAERPGGRIRVAVDPPRA